jgi:hypothetical protein
MDQEADAGDHEEHQNRQLIDLVGDMDAESSGTDPWEDVDDKGSVFGGGGARRNPAPTVALPINPATSWCFNLWPYSPFQRNPSNGRRTTTMISS